MKTVTLNEWEFKACVDVANARMAVSGGDDRDHANVRQRNHMTRIANEINGACAEMAVAKALGKFWTPSVNTFHEIPDIAPDIEVRAVEDPGHSLIIRDNDADNRWYILVLAQPPKFTILGQIKGSEAKKDAWKRNPHGHRMSWFVPRSALMPPKEDT